MQPDLRRAGLVARLRSQRNRHSAQPVFTFLSDGSGAVEELTWQELDRQARSIAAVLQERGLRGERVLLLYVPGLDFIAALYGCFYAGAVAVPAYPPEPGRLERALPRLQAIIKEATPALVLSTAPLLEMAQFIFEQAPELARVPREASDVLAKAGREDSWHEHEPLPEDVALIQYTSGSTSTPKGVVVTHGALSINLWMVHQGAGLGQDSVISSWLPFYHDFGLIGGIMLPVFSGIRAVLMAPLDFLQQPIRWLRSIQQYRATDTFIPNFALDLCVRKTTHEERQSLDLGCLQQIVVAAEPVRHTSLERFTETFTPHGLQPRVFCPSYGLAEAVLGVSGGPRHGPRRTVFLDSEQLQRTRWSEVERTHPRAQALVGCGQPLPEVELCIVDPQTLQPLPAGQVGEVWVSGPHLASGYWNRPEETARTFQGRLANGDPRHFLRTGDLGYLLEGELFLAGRIKDLIIIRGRNYYPQDLELTVERCNPRVRPGCVAAFSIEDKGEEKVSLVAEVETRELPTGEEREVALREVLRSIIAAVSTEYSLHVHAVALIKARTIDKTSSGKIARHASRQSFLAGKLQAELLWTASEVVNNQRRAPGAATAEDLRRTHIVSALHRAVPEDRGRLLFDYVERELRAVVGRNTLRLLDPEIPLQQVGLDSLGALDFTSRIEKDLGVSLPVAKLLESLSVRGLVEYLLQSMEFRDVQTPSRAAPTLALSLQPMVVRRPLFFIGGAFGSSLYLVPLTRALGVEQPFFALQYPGLGEGEPPLRTVEAMALRFLDEVVAIQPAGPYVLGGHSFGGLVAYEMAQQLRLRGEQVSHLLLADTSPAGEGPPDTGDSELMALFELLYCLSRLSGREPQQSLPLEQLVDKPVEEQRHLLREALTRQEQVPAGFPLQRLLEIFKSNMEAMRLYRPLPSQVPVTLLRAREGFPPHSLHPQRTLQLHFGEASLGWEELCSSLRVVEVPGNHFTMVTEPHVQQFGQVLRQSLSEAGTFEIGLERLSWRRPSAAHRNATRRKRVSVSFNPLREDYIQDPFPIYDELRAQDPVHWSPAGAWCVTRYRDIASGLRDKRFLVDRECVLRGAPSKPSPEPGRLREGALPAEGWLSAEASDPFSRLYRNSMMFVDPPRHTRLRRLLAGAFEPMAVRRWRGYIEQAVDELLTGMRQQPEPDLIRDFAFPLPTSVIAEMLGIPREDVPMLRKWSFDVVRMLDFFVSKEISQTANQSAAAFMQYLREHVHRHRQDKGAAPNVLTLMSEAEAEGSRLSMDELLGNCLLLFIAGFITTTNVIGNAVLALSKAPDQARLLRAQPDLIEKAVEEFLRYDGAFRHVLRTAAEDTELGGKRIRRGDLVMFMLAAGNRDPEAFPEPNRLELTRNAKHHLAFAHGIHYCLGASLARLELQVALQAVVRRFPDLRILPEGLRWHHSLAFRGLEQMRVAFDGELG